MGTEQLTQMLLPDTETRGSISIANALKSDTENQTDLTIQPTVIHIKQVTGPGQSDRKNPPSGV